MDDDQEDPETAKTDRVNTARRRLLRNIVYMPPAVLGIVTLASTCAAGSCSPSACCPAQCRPNKQCLPCTSDVRLKREIATIANALELILAL